MLRSQPQETIVGKEIYLILFFDLSITNTIVNVHSQLKSTVFGLFSADAISVFTVFTCRKLNITTLMWRDCESCFEQTVALAAGETQNLPCDHEMEGRYVIVALIWNGILPLCEVSVYG